MFDVGEEEVEASDGGGGVAAVVARRTRCLRLGASAVSPALRGPSGGGGVLVPCLSSAGDEDASGDSEVALPSTAVLCTALLSVEEGPDGGVGGSNGRVGEAPAVAGGKDRDGRDGERLRARL